MTRPRVDYATHPVGLAAVTTALRWTALVTLTAHLLFSHGCHGDEDHELFSLVDRAGVPGPVHGLTPAQQVPVADPK